jgi:hypothetical protein
MRAERGILRFNIAEKITVYMIEMLGKLFPVLVHFIFFAQDAHDSAVVRAEIVTPIGDAVNLVHHQQADSAFEG